MEKSYRIALWQGPSAQGDIKLAFAALGQAMRAAAAMGARVLVAPELYLPGYNNDGLAEVAQPRGGPWHQRLSAMAMAAGCGIVVGYVEREGERLYNSAVAFDAMGVELAHYRKVQLYGPREQALFTPGEAYATFALGGRRCALLICYDVEFAPHIAALAAQGVDLILCPTANMAPFTHVAKVTVPAMAANYGLSIAYANYCGVEGDLTYVGLSLIADPYGEVLAQAGTGPALLVADLPEVLDAARLSTQARDFRVI
ncbi:MAG: carbon-nitrogen hydrolase family protein [Cypionkella sp.]